MDVIQFNPLHLYQIELQPAQQNFKDIMFKEEYQQLLACGEARTVLSGGRIVMCAGVFPLTNYMGRAWALLATDQKAEFVRMSRAIRDFLNKSGYARIDTPVRRDYSDGHRWCRLLGFINETPEQGMKYYGHDGLTYDLYALYPKEQEQWAD